ncbi:mechanosensitive ion channel family protein [Oceanisphaera psychrotolerans]|uniref:Small-conductance mechanosensitive channel n=1 Tax=Oceanisphaera psychrotolerans TaxID=1414654 RepID=A0A1J4QBR4_9GAMM|nr:mechanosensitive ion channel domain-containing protein [Oceanisphaera psychrotolerans]OIN04537.1 mechanosensitive ion channel protein MscS [Oceanisphaera psychrotolerans]
MDTEQVVRLFREVTTRTLMEALAVVLVAILLVWLSQKLLPWLADRLHSRQRLLVLALVPTIRILVIVAALLWIVPLFVELTVQNTLAIMGAAGLAIGFALKDYVSSLLAGVVAAYELPYRPGDWIEVDGCYGEVRHVGMRAIEIVTPDDTVVFIPHQKLWAGLIHNANNGGASLMCVVSFYLDPDHDAHEVRRVLQDVALSSPYLKLNLPVVVVLEEQPWGTHYRIKAYPMDPRQQFQFMSDLTARGKGALRRMQVRFARMSPEQAMDPGME